MATQKLQIKQTILDGVQYGIKNVGPLLLTVILYLVTFIVPWLNVGTTIGLYKSIIKIGRGEIINPLDLFAKENWNNVGDFFLLMGFLTMGLTAAALFLIIPMYVMAFAWMFAIFFYIEKGLSPHKAMKVSYKVTYGEKWTIFWILLIVCLAFSLVGSLFLFIPKVGVILYALVVICMAAVMIAVEGVMYKHFSDKADEMFAEKAAGCGCKAPEAPAAEPAPAAEAPEAPAE